MKKFIQKIICFTLLISICVILFFYFLFAHVAPQYSGSYTASLLDKYQYLKSIPTSKIVLLGDSNVAFGFKSELIEEEFGMPVVNMGLQSGLGNAFLENLAKINVHEGDIYILCHSNYSDNGKFIDPSLAMITLENHLELWKLLTPTQALQLPAALPYYARNAFSLWITNKGNTTVHDVYSRNSFNQYGDISYPREKGYCTFGEQTIPEINKVCTDRINELNEYLTSKGASLYISSYPISYGEYTPPVSEYIKFQNTLASQLDCPIISDFTDYFFDYSYFWDSALHLTNEGATIRTLQLINDLNKLN